MEVGSTVTWRESVLTEKSGRRIKKGERIVTGTIIEHSHLRTGGKTIRIAVTAVEGDGQDIVGRQIWRKRAKISEGRSWHRAMIERVRAKARAKRYREKMKSRTEPPRL